MIKGVLLALVCALAAEARPLSLVVGRGELMQYTGEVKQVAASEPKIADVVVISPHEVMINAKGPGRTTVVIWEAGATPMRYDVEVLADTSDFDQFRSQMRTEFPGSHIEVTGKGDTLALTGDVISSAESKRAAGLAQTRAKTIINLLKAPPEPELRQILLEVNSRPSIALLCNSSALICLAATASCSAKPPPSSSRPRASASCNSRMASSQTQALILPTCSIFSSIGPIST